MSEPQGLSAWSAGSRGTRTPDLVKNSPGSSHRLRMGSQQSVPYSIWQQRAGLQRQCRASRSTHALGRKASCLGAL